MCALSTGWKYLNTEKSTFLAGAARMVGTVRPRLPKVNGAGAVNWLVSNQRSMLGCSSAGLTPVVSSLWAPPKQKQVLVATPQLYIGGPCDSVMIAFSCQPPSAAFVTLFHVAPSALPRPTGSS